MSPIGVGGNFRQSSNIMYWKKDYFAPRPDCESLVNKKLDSLGLNIMRDWKICLKEYINKYYKNYLL